MSLAERVRVATVPKQELRQMGKLGDGEISSERRLLSFLANNTNACDLIRGTESATIEEAVTHQHLHHFHHHQYSRPVSL